MTTKQPDQEFVEMMVKAIVDHPEDVKVTRSIDERGVLLELKVNPADMGQVIGRKGQTIESIRNLLRVLGAKLNARLNLKVIEPTEAEKQAVQTAQPTQSATQTPPQPTQELPKKE